MNSESSAQETSAFHPAENKLFKLPVSKPNRFWKKFLQESMYRITRNNLQKIQ